MTFDAQILLPKDADSSVLEAFERLQKVLAEQADTLLVNDKTIAGHEQTIVSHKQTIAARDQTISVLITRLQLATEQRFGRKGERFDPAQQIMFDEAISEDIGALEAQIEAAESGFAEASPQVPPKAKPASKKPVRKPLPEHLPRETVHLPAKHCDCPACGSALHQIGQEVSEKLAVKPAVYFALQTIRPTMACRSCESVYRTPSPPEIINGGIPAPSLLAQVIIHKYVDHCPHYRQSQIALRSGIFLPPSTLSEWTGGSAVALIPLVDRLRSYLHQCAAIHADETPIQMLNPGPKANGEKRAKNVQRAYLFAYRSAEIGMPPIVVFDFQTSRSGTHAAQFLTGYTGALVVDDFSGYKALFKDTPVTELACWAHARRKFYELHIANKSLLAAEALSRISGLYEIEREVKDASTLVRYQHRQTYALPKVHALFEWLKKLRPTTVNNTGTARAMDYLLRREASFLRYLEDGRYPIDNNPVENAIRPIALGRKNWLFAGSARAGERAAAIMSLLSTAKACGLNQHAYLEDVLTRLPSTKAKDIDSLLPQNWKPLK